MAPPTIAPPIGPAATPAATPRCALAGVAASEPAIVATATKAANVFFMSWALLEMAPSRSAGFRVTHALFETGRLAKKAHNSQSRVNVFRLVAGKNDFFRPRTKTAPKTLCFRGRQTH